MELIPENEIDAVTDYVDHLEHESTHLRTHRIMVAIAIPVIGYLILSADQPDTMGVPIWAALTFVLIPVLTGIVVAHSLPDESRKTRFGRSFLFVGCTAAVFTFVNLGMVRGRISEQPDPVALVELMVLVTVVFGAICGVVAGAAAALMQVKST